MDPLFVMVVWSVILLVTLASLALGIAALVSAARLPVEVFGPWWDNVQTTWLVGFGIAFLLPFGSLVTGCYWFLAARRPLATTGRVARPFWAGPPKVVPFA